ncbi:MAG TPA: DegT/DnrJ/EryC1/StrS family aminotransferase, partial [Pseudomonas sp.]|nr:DegT/DnrJ/EryC1/StrS family aminotransferase [Pseudomonas sp.]
EIAHRYTTRLGDYVDLQRAEADSQLNHSYYPIAVNDEQQLLRLRSALNTNGINPRRYFYPSLDTLEYLQPQAAQTASRSLSERVLCLPIYPGLLKDDQERVINTVIAECSLGRAVYQSPNLAQVM